jgi:hypothetical protein
MDKTPPPTLVSRIDLLPYRRNSCTNAFMDERRHKVEPRMFPTVAAVRLEGLHPQITRRRMATKMPHPGAILVHRSRPIVAFAVSAACAVFCALMLFFKTQYRQVALPCIRPDAMHPCPKIKVSRVLRHRSGDHCVRLCIVLGNDEHLRPTGVYNANPSGRAGCGAWNHSRSVLDNKKTRQG